MFGWLKWNRKSESFTVTAPLVLSERESLSHDIRNAIVGIHRERLDFKREITLLMRSYLASYERTGEQLRRIEQCLERRSEPVPIPEDVLQ